MATKLGIVTHKTGVHPDIVFQGSCSEAMAFYRSFRQPGEVAVFFCRTPEMSKRLRPEPVPQVEPELIPAPAPTGKKR